MGVALLAEPPTEGVRTVAPSDDELIALALTGRGDAFGTLVERYERAVYHLAYRTLREIEEAKDACQEAWIKAYRALASFRPGAKFATWIFTICYRVCCDRLAKRKRYSGEEPPDFADPSAGPEGVVEAAEEAARLRAAVEALPEKYRVVVTLFHLQGKQYEEIAEVLSLPLGTVKTHLFRAKDLLRAALGPTAQRRTT
ncbi:MAG TPA: sigma-70 family RNA polymerase sigma factor [Candidatus Lustribacter sp.]|jgi:RNA polymerase sigma-70 factor (ECF subfamily)|nr:sigma-70 family RNA polymerase sigma factor [Candidatus Lustribacter sp.]